MFAFIAFLHITGALLMWAATRSGEYKLSNGSLFGWGTAALFVLAVAAMLFLRHGRLASYYIGWADEAGRKLNAHNRLLWQAMVALRQQGVTDLDLGGINTHDLPGISRFKLGTGGRVLTLAGTYF